MGRAGAGGKVRGGEEKPRGEGRPCGEGRGGRVRRGRVAGEVGGGWEGGRRVGEADGRAGEERALGGERRWGQCKLSKHLREERWRGCGGGGPGDLEVKAGEREEERKAPLW